MKNTFTIGLYPKKQIVKPTSPEEIARISNELNTISGLTIEDISQLLVPPYSFSWSPAIFSGKRSNQNWKQQQVFALDFDGGISPDAVLKRFKEFGITPNILYYTFSDTPITRKFRVLLFVDVVITELDFRNYIQMGLKNLFPESDPHCHDASRFFFGGTQSEVLNSDPIQLIELFNCISIAQNFG